MEKRSNRYYRILFCGGKNDSAINNNTASCSVDCERQMLDIVMQTENPIKLAYDSNFPIELRDTFYSHSKKGNIFHVRLNSSGLFLERNMTAGGQKDHLVNISNIIGGRCICIQKPTTTTCGACTANIVEKKRNRIEVTEDAYLYVFAYVLKKNVKKNLRRERCVITLRFRSYDNHEDNMREAERWYLALKYHRNNYLFFCNVPCNSLSENTVCSLDSKRLLILLNPKSGSGKARELFNLYVVTILNEAETAYDLHITKHSNYAYNFVRQKNLSIWSGIVAIGGDGLFHEILNGLLKRKDWNIVGNNVTLGIIPCGSGNGLARSLAHYFQEPYEPKPILGAALSLVSGQSAPMDVVEIEQKNQITYSFLSVGWGLISDIDIESERLRSLGYQRFTIWTLYRLINLRTYRGRISYLLKNNFDEEFNTRIINNKTNLESIANCNTFPQCYWFSKSTSDICDAEFEDVISLETGNQSNRSRCNSLLSSVSRISTYYSIPESIYYSITSNSDYQEKDLENSNEKLISRLDQLDKNKLPSLRDPLPNTWHIEDGDFVMIHAVYQTHLGSACYFSPQSKLNDGIIYLVMIREGISRSQLFNFLINLSTGTHLPNKNTDFIKVEKVIAFRLEPLDNSGILTVDGERVENDTLQARIFPRTVNVMVPNVTLKK